MAENKVLYKDGDLSYCILTQDYKNEAHEILAEIFCDMPACQTRLECNSKLTREIVKEFWFQYIGCDMDDFITEGLSVIAFDTKNNEIAGIMATRHLLTCAEYKARYPKHEYEGAILVDLCAILEGEATNKMPELTEPNNTVEMALLGVHSEYRGKNIANNLVRLSLPVVKAAGYTYASLIATSYFSSKVSEKNGFTSIHEIDVRSLLWEGGKTLQNMKEPHGHYKYWVKKL